VARHTPVVGHTPPVAGHAQPAPDAPVEVTKADAPAEETAPDAAADARADFGRLRWRCRRGIKELDVLLERYIDQRFRAASADEQAAFRQLLATQDTIIYAYCLGQQRPPDRFLHLIERITAN